MTQNVPNPAANMSSDELRKLAAAYYAPLFSCQAVADYLDVSVEAIEEIYKRVQAAPGGFVEDDVIQKIALNYGVTDKVAAWEIDNHCQVPGTDLPTLSKRFGLPVANISIAVKHPDNRHATEEVAGPAEAAKILNSVDHGNKRMASADHEKAPLADVIDLYDEIKQTGEVPQGAKDKYGASFCTNLVRGGMNYIAQLASENDQLTADMAKIVYGKKGN